MLVRARWVVHYALELPNSSQPGLGGHVIRVMALYGLGDRELLVGCSWVFLEHRFLRLVVAEQFLHGGGQRLLVRLDLRALCAVCQHSKLRLAPVAPCWLLAASTGARVGAVRNGVVQG
jgi:hypothetical protein